MHAVVWKKVAILKPLRVNDYVQKNTPCMTLGNWVESSKS